FLYPLDVLIERDRYYGGVKSYLETIAEPIRPVVQRKGPAIGGNAAGDHIWAMPGPLGVRVLMWRKDLFQEAGLDPEQPPRDWEELLYFAKRLSDPAQEKFGINISGGPQAAWDFMAFLWSAGGEAVVQNKDGEWEAAYGSRAAAEALDFYIRLATEPWSDPDGKQHRGYTALSAEAGTVAARDLWAEGRVGMYVGTLNGEHMAGDVDMSLIGIAPFPPRFRDGKSSTELNAIMCGIFSRIEGRKNSAGEWCSPDEIREAAWKYVKFINSMEAKQIYVDVLVENGLGRTLSPEYLQKFGYPEYLKYFPPDLEETFREAVRNGKPEPYGRNCQMVYTFMTEPLNDALQAARKEELPADTEARLNVLQDILKRSEIKTTEQMIGKLSPEERARRNTWAVVVAILICAIFCFALYKVWQIFSPKDSFSGRSKGWQFRKNAVGYLITLPALISIFLWIYYPMVSGTMLLFQDYKVAGGSEWTGMDNLADVLFSLDWWKSVWNTLRYMFLILGLGFVAPIILAILLQEVSHCKIIYRTLSYLPAVMSGLVVVYMWKLFYQSGPTGIMNQVLQSLTDGLNFILVPAGSLFDPAYTGLQFEPIAWLEDSKWAMLSCVLPAIWASAGPGCLIYLAALKGVPEDIYEAAEIDGANFFQKIWHVTLPTLKSLIIINFVGAFIGAAQSGGMILIMTFGNADTNVAELQIFKEAYTHLRFGTAIGMAWILGITTLFFTIYQLKRLSNMEFKITGK
ncbi:MAG: extracellular solute-binding protein, partial [Lentisphaeria bacterium]|nr:extracellular solute-binding protein [Lentisphaeria bacterium]